MKPQPPVVRPRPLIDARGPKELDAWERAQVSQAERNARRGDAPPKIIGNVLRFGSGK